MPAAATGGRSAPARRSRRNQLRRSGAAATAGAAVAVGVVAVEDVTGSALECLRGMPVPRQRPHSKPMHHTGGFLPSPAADVQLSHAQNEALTLTTARSHQAKTPFVH